jgi:uncharacterized protein with ParB-like and HNH nuclease domain
MADNKLQSLNEIFNQRFFRIPDFQRGFSWEDKQLSDFWEDLLNLKSDKIHYTGLLTLESLTEETVENKDQWKDDLWLFRAGMSAYYIVDGQQRITTSILLINEILNGIEPNGTICYQPKNDWVSRFLYRQYKDTFKSYIFGYEKDNPSYEYYKTKILGQKSIQSDHVPRRTLYTENLLYAKNFFKKQLENKDQQFKEEIFSKLVNGFKYNLYKISEDLDVFVTFETMNNRGKSLSNLELLKNRLIYLTTLFDDKDGSNHKLRRDVNDVWKTIYEYLGRNPDNPLDDDDFLYNHWIAYFKYDRKESSAYAKFLLGQKFTAKAVLKGELHYNEVLDYINSLRECVKSWYFIFNSYDDESPYSNEIKYWLEKLNRLGFAAFAPLIMVALNKEKDPEILVSFIKLCERFVFLVFRISQRPSNTKNSYFYRMASDYNHSRPSEVDKNKDTTMTTVIWSLKRMIDGWKEDEDGNKHYIGWYDIERFYDYIEDQFEKEGNKGYYSWSAIKFFLYEYEEYKKEESDGNTKRQWSSFDRAKKEESIEHILPQTPDHPSWKMVLSELTSSKVHRCIHSLGNLVLLAKNKNPKQGNRSFQEKKKRINSKGLEVGYFNGSYSEIEVNQYDSWTPAEILDRGIKMLQFMEDRWDIKLTDQNNKTYERLLQLEFVIE